jgi:hypothetical protein
MKLTSLSSILIDEWHIEKNGIFDPKAVKPFSNKKVWWKCKKNHEWQAPIAKRSKGAGCPFCKNRKFDTTNNLSARFPKLIKEWDFFKNKNVSPEEVLPGSTRKVWWKCKKGHSWLCRIDHRTRGSNCPYCSGRYVTGDTCLLKINPLLADEWHPVRNGTLTPEMVMPSAGKNVWWKCVKGHEWMAKVSERNRGFGCPYCTGRKVCADNCLGNLRPDLAEQWHKKKNGKLTPFDVSTGCGKKVWWKCGSGHVWMTSVNHRNQGSGCPQCYRLRKSKQVRVRTYFDAKDFKKETTNDQT